MTLALHLATFLHTFFLLLLMGKWIQWDPLLFFSLVKLKKRSNNMVTSTMLSAIFLALGGRGHGIFIGRPCQSPPRVSTTPSLSVRGSRLQGSGGGWETRRQQRKICGSKKMTMTSVYVMAKGHFGGNVGTLGVRPIPGRRPPVFPCGSKASNDQPSSQWQYVLDCSREHGRDLINNGQI